MKRKQFPSFYIKRKKQDILRELIGEVKKDDDVMLEIGTSPLPKETSHSYLPHNKRMETENDSYQLRKITFLQLLTPLQKNGNGK